MIRISGLKKSFGGVNAVDSCNMNIQRGKITAIIGPNGSGKSTLFHLISGIYRKDSGKILFDGKDISSIPDYKIAKAGVSRTFQEVRLFRNLSIGEHMNLAIRTNDELIFSSCDYGRESQKIREIFKLVHLNKPLETTASELSYGQRKLLDIAMAFAKPHSFLMLDEPVAGVNPKVSGQIREMLKKLRKNGETILLIEHDMNFVMGLADYVIVMDNGKVIAEGKPEKIRQNKKVLEAYLGT